ncbi:MAG: ankyrin repeat domain-containing protein [Bryobacterales bacterium]|nr:ankyrin repeat domain-containing protein [Bryobacterales bacterium]
MRVLSVLAASCFLAVGACAARLGSALIDAVQADDSAAVKSLLAQGAGVNAREEDGSTALTWAVMRSNTAIAELLLDSGANPNLANALGIGALSLAIANGSTPMVKLLLAKGADPNVARENGETPLMTAARMSQVEVMKLLLAHGANVNAQEKKFHQTALMWAAGTPVAVRLLLDHHADIHSVTTTWNVKYTIYAPTTVTLGKTGIPWNTDGDYTTRRGGQNALFFAVQKHDLESARMLVDAGIDVNQAAADGTTPLLAALYKWDPPHSSFVPGKGAPAQAGSSQKFGPDLAMAHFLLDRGANVKVADGAGYTPLHGVALAVAYAAKSGSGQRGGGVYGKPAALLSLGRGVDVPPGMLEQALAVAGRLLAAGADPNRQTLYPTPGPAGDVRINPAPPGSSPFHIAANSDSLELVKMLAGHGANPNQLRKDGHTPFSVAVLAGDLAVVKEMILRGANLKMLYNPDDKIPDPVEAITLSRRDQSIMHLAALSGSAPVVEYLYSQGVPLDLKNDKGETPLALADSQERYREAAQRQNADGDPERLKKIVRHKEMTDAIRKLLARPTPPTAAR